MPPSAACFWSAAQAMKDVRMGAGLNGLGRVAAGRTGTCGAYA
jgi:hypothetical protein